MARAPGPEAGAEARAAALLGALAADGAVRAAVPGVGAEARAAEVRAAEVNLADGADQVEGLVEAQRRVGAEAAGRAREGRTGAGTARGADRAARARRVTGGATPLS